MQKTLIYIDVLTKNQIRATGAEVRISDYVTIERGQWQILCIQFVERTVDSAGIVTLKPYALKDGNSYVLVGDNNFDDEDNLLFKSLQSTVPFDENDGATNRFNIEGDWVGGELAITGDEDYYGTTWIESTNYTADPSKGQMSIRINADTKKFVDVLGNKEKQTSNLFINIKQYTSGISNPSTIGWFKFAAVNTVRDWSKAQEAVPEGSQLTPFIDSYLRNPIEMEFSVDGASWHREQADEDEYYHFRIANTSTQFSSPVYIMKGAPVRTEFSTDGTEWYPSEVITPESLGSDYDLILPYITFVRYSTAEGWTPALRFKGIDGEDGKSVKIQYSADNSSWHDTAVDSDKYIRISADDGVTWSTGLLFKGTDGKDGEPGTPGEDGTPAGFGTPTANATTLETGSNATVSITASGEDTAKVFTFEFGIPKGERGDSFTPDAIGATAEKANYAAEPKGFAFLDSTESKLYFKLSDDSGDWSDGTPFGKGDKGDTGEPAGFGVPTATVNTLSADSSATVSVTATGENTSKVFSFVFGIPKGKDGKTPVRGTDFYTEEDKNELLDELEDRLLNGEWGTEA